MYNRRVAKWLKQNGEIDLNSKGTFECSNPSKGSQSWEKVRQGWGLLVLVGVGKLFEFARFTPTLWYLVSYALSPQAG
jgi:hypothetical protein